MHERFPKTLNWALRDIRHSWRHFRIVFLCLVFSLIAITAVHVTGASVLNSIQTNARVILGADWVVRQLYTPIPEKERAWLKQRGAELIDTVEMRVMLINPATDDSTLVELKSVDSSYPLYGKAETDPANETFYTPLTKGVVLDKALAERLDVALGDTVQLGDKKFLVTAWLAHEPDRAGGGRFGLAPRVFISEDGLNQTGLKQPSSLAYHDLRVKWPITADQQKLKKQIKLDFPDATWHLTDTEKASPQIQRYVNNLVQFLSLIGLSTLLIGGIGIANGMRAYLQTRLTTIAIFKSVGMNTRQIRSVYLWQIAAIGLIGTVCGVFIGSMIPVWFAPLLQSFMPFPVAIHIGPESIAIPVSFGVLTTLIFSLWPLGETERTSPAVLFRSVTAPEFTRPHLSVIMTIIALVILLSGIVIFSVNDRLFAFFFIIGALITFALFFFLGRGLAYFAGIYSHKTSLIYRLALHNLGRKGNTTAQTLVSLGIGLTVLISITMIEHNLRATLHENLPIDAPAFFFLDIQPDQKDAFATIVSAAPTARNLVLLPNLRGRLVEVNGIPAAKALKDKRESWLLANERGFTYTATQPAHSEITEGEWWPEDYQGPPLVSVVDDVKRGFDVKPGDILTVSILGRTIKAKIANVREVSWTNFTVNFAMTFAPGALEGAPHSWLATVVADPEQEVPLQRIVTKNFPNISMIRLSDAIKTVSDLLGQMNQAVRIMALLALTTGLLVLIEALIATRMQRNYDTVILKVIGMPRRLMTRALLIEFALLGLASSLASVVIGTLISWIILSVWMDLPWAMYPMVGLATMGISLAAIILTGWLALRRLLASPAIAHLRNE